jgi:hypothetical protein
MGYRAKHYTKRATDNMGGEMRSYEIRKDNDEQGGFLLYMIDDDVVVQVETFLPTYYGNYTDDDTASNFAHMDATNRGKEWVAETKISS